MMSSQGGLFICTVKVVTLLISVGVPSLIYTASGCNTNYHNNFSICNGIRTYYMQKPQYIQVGEHQFVENKVVDLWTGQMLLGW
jgi:hypothetical protein